ncbi:MAG: hypothetical protein N4A35_05815 [Flavobacteriales bacterium]|jgi:two-component sensor histidine kinase/ligand-binding sensor domain-containing protein|nr:hypothetical protein [Flavobacteriales bacterium]
MYKLIPLITLFLFNALTSIAQQHSLIQYSVTEGLAQSEASYIYQDSLGFLWIATTGGGVSKFDGVHFENFNENNNLGGNIVTDITEGEDHKIYFASTWGPLSYYHKGLIHQLPDQETGFHHIIYDQQKKIIYAAKNKAIYYLSDSIWQSVSTHNQEKIKGFFYDQKHSIYYFTSKEIYSLNTETKESQKLFQTQKFITTVKWAPNNELIVSLENEGIYSINSVDSLTPFLFNHLLPSPIQITNIVYDLNNTLWFSTNNHGVYKYVNNELVNICDQNGIPSSAINSLFCDRQNNIWIGVIGEGIFKYIKTPFINYSNIEGLNKANNFAILKDAKGNLWTGTSHNGCFVYDGKDVINYTSKNHLPNNTVFSIIETPDHTIWLATRKGIVQYKNGVFNTIDKTQGLVSNAVNYLLYDKQDRLWVATNEGISMIQDKKITNYNHENGLSNEQIHAIYEDHKGIIWFGTSDGLLKYYEGNFRKYSIIDGLCNSYVGSIIEDDNGILWVGTDRCISKLVNEQFIPYTEKDGLNSTIIYLMNKDNEGNLWVGTNKGLDKIKLNKQSEIESINFFGKNEGFYGTENNTRGTFKDQEGNLYFATIKGIFKYQAKKTTKNDISFPLYLTNIKLFLNNIEETYQYGNKNAFGIPDSLILPADKNHLTFEFLGIDLKSSTEIKYSYKLENFDSTWFTNMGADYAVYSNIPPGAYTFKVKATSKNSQSTPDFVSCYVKIEEPLPPFYYQWWFVLLCSILIISIMYNLVFLRNRALRVSKEELEDKVRERTKEISKQNKEKTVLLQEIHHRVKNNLQIINSLFNIQAHYTTNEETKTLFKESQNRILSMSKIHQSLYESNDFSKLNIKTYVTNLVNDIKESYAVNKEVNLDLNIDDNIHIGLDGLIPFALIVNEIISNSLKYAFDNPTGNIIEINIKQHDDKKTIIHIGDNGKGLPSDFNWENPTSMGIDLIKTLADQLEGTITVDSSSQGTNYLLTFVSK